MTLDYLHTECKLVHTGEPPIPMIRKTAAQLLEHSWLATREIKD